MSEKDQSRPIIVGVDGSEGSVDALRAARRIAEALQSPVEVVACWQPPARYYPAVAPDWHPERDAHQLAVEAVSNVYGTSSSVPIRVESGPAASSLIEASRGAEMLVVGSRGLGGFVGLLLGSVSAACAEHARCPVLVVHSGADNEHLERPNE